MNAGQLVQWKDLLVPLNHALHACLKEPHKKNFFTNEAVLKKTLRCISYAFVNIKLLGIWPFESHFGSRANTPLSNISTIPKNSSHQASLACMFKRNTSRNKFLHQKRST